MRPLFVLFLLLAVCMPAIRAQDAAVRDSLSQKLDLLRSLVQSGNYEQAQVEAVGLRQFMRRQRVLCPAEAVPLLSGIYHNNKDQESAWLFFNEAEVDARRDANPATKAALLKTLVAAYREWQLPDRALVAQQMLNTVQDTLSARTQRQEITALHQRMDSMAQVLALEQQHRNNTLTIERDRAYLLAGSVALVFLLLLLANYRAAQRWKARLDRKELEFDMMRAELVHKSGIQAAEAGALAVQQASAESKTTHLPPSMPGDRHDKTALVIEPNRQVVLYLKSLLSDRFQVEVADNANEGLHKAGELLPDLIICDAVLNGKTGIDIVRQIKLSERTNHIPVILLSERHGNDGKLDALRAGAEAWFTRPVLDTEFDASVKHLLDSHLEQHEQFSRFLHLYFTDRRQTLSDPFLLRAVQTVETNLADPDFMADDLSRKLQMSKNHCFRKLKALTGKEPMQLIREMRLEKAKVLLEKRAGTPHAIAEMVGFSNPGTFSLAFKEYFGENTLLLGR